ncbi:unnamed protein product, partial [Echinostoma caproni]|uniref:APG6 domain-containing protein n=1 Tax=Echinostoma caproni TaxID=27848 RepID=A0A182ZZB2_9TREM
AETAVHHVESGGLGHAKQIGSPSREWDKPKILLRPISYDWSRQLPTDSRIAYAHQSLVLGYLCAMLSASPEDGNNVDWTPNTPCLIAWSGRTLQQWPTYIQDILRDHPEVQLHLLPRVTSGAAESTESIFMHLTSYDLVRGFLADGTRRKERVLRQFVLARCLLTCLYGIFHESHSRLL